MALDVVIAGGHGSIGLQLGRRLAARGDRVRGLIRDPGQSGDLTEAGVEPVVCDLESAAPDDVARAVEHADAVVFAAGAGPGSGEARKETMDRDGAIGLLKAASAQRVGRYVIVSSRGADSTREGDGFAAYLRAKGAADDAVAASGLGWTIVRPGRLTDDDATGRIEARASVSGEYIPRADVAATLAAVLDTPATERTTFELVSGETPIADALAALAGP